MHLIGCFNFRIFVNDSNQFVTSYGDSTKECSVPPIQDSPRSSISNVRITYIFNKHLFYY